MKQSRAAWRLVLACALAVSTMPVWAQESQNVPVNVNATIPLRVALAITRDTNSSTTGSANNVVFNKIDKDDLPGDPNSSSAYMYAPPRSEGPKNYHVLKPLSWNGSNFKLSAKVTGTIDGQPAADYLELFFGGIFEPDPANSSKSRLIAGTPTTANTWDRADGFQRTLTNHPVFDGSGSVNYRLSLRGGAGSNGKTSGTPLTAGTKAGVQLTWTAFTS